MEVGSLAVESGSFMAEYLPAFLARRVFTIEKLKREVSLSLRDIAPIHVSGTPPALSVWFRMVNHSSLNVQLNRISVEAWFGQPIAVMMNIIPRDVPRRSEISDLRVIEILGPVAAAHARSVAETRSGRIYLYVTAVCSTRVRDFNIETTIERDASDAKFDGPPLVLKAD